MNKALFKKLANTVLNVLMYFFLVVCICSVIITVMAKKDSDGAAVIFGYQLRIVTSDSMAECEYTDVSDYEIGDIPLRSLIIVKVMPDDSDKADEWYRSVKVGDVLTFRYVYTTQVTITHRVTAITEKEDGGFLIELAGDNKNADNGQLIQVIDTSIPYNTNYVIGRVSAVSYFLGVIMSFLMTQVGIILVIIVPCFCIIIFEVLKISKVFTSDKKQKQKEEREKNERELAELRQRLAELEAMNAPKGDDAQ